MLFYLKIKHSSELCMQKMEAKNEKQFVENKKKRGGDRKEQKAEVKKKRDRH